MNTTTEEIRRGSAALVERAVDRITELTIEEDRIKAEKAELRAIVRGNSLATTGKSQTTSKGGTKKRRRGTIGSSGGVSSNSLAVVAHTVAKYQGDSFTLADITARSSIGRSSVRKALLLLREREAIRAAERKRTPGTPRPSQHYRIMDENKLQEIALNQS